MHKDLSNQVIVHKEKDGIEYIQFKKLLDYKDRLAHCFSTRICKEEGTGNGELNLRFDGCASREAVVENYKKLCSAIDVDYRNLVFSKQVHEDVIRVVGPENKGEGILSPRPEGGCDGLVTGTANVALATLYADCVPVLFYDPVKNIAAMSHAGWKGTVKKIAAKTVKFLHDTYDCETKDIIACIGPSIGPCCFEVDQPVAIEFKKAFEFWPEIIEVLPSGKSKINLWKTNQLQLMQAGLYEQNIQISQLCTVCNSDIFFSYRANKGQTDRMAAIMQLRALS